MSDPRVCERMRADWNQRAREDAGYYVAFGRRNQDDDEFFRTGLEIAEGLLRELKRMSALPRRERWRALEIGCGLGRLMRPLSQAFSEVHGIDVSDEMIAQARQKLAGIPNTVLHVTAGSDLCAFEDESFEFVYSYAVFQHIPARDVVLRYLSEAVRVLKPGGIFRFQVNGLPESATRYDTWSGVRITAAEIREFAAANRLQLMALEGVSTQYMWVTLRKPAVGQIRKAAPASVRIRKITNCHRSEPVIPARGRFATASLWLENLPDDCDLNTLEVRIGGLPATPSYLGPRGADGLQQLNAAMPGGTGTGLQDVEVRWGGEAITPPAFVRVIPPGPVVPRLVSVTDGVDLLSGTVIVSRSIKVGIDEAPEGFALEAGLDGAPLPAAEVFCVDPVPPRFEYNVRVPETVPAGPHLLEIRLGGRPFPPVAIQVL